jgi:hypothetical protein
MSFRLLSVSLLCCLCTSGAVTASTFELSGTVMDEMGGGLIGARLKLIHDDTVLVRTTTANAAGRYNFPGLVPGSYSLEVAAAGFATSRFAGLRYFADTKPIFNITLRLREVQESMTFTGEVPLINSSGAQIGLSVEERQLRELPLTRRDYLELVSLEGAAQEVIEDVPGPRIVGAPLPSLNGMNAHYTFYLLDGSSNTRDQHGVVHMDISLEAVEEFRVLSGQQSAEYGRSLGGIVSVATSSGGNDYHGTLFAFLRPGSWDASDPLTGENSSLDRQDLGFTFSGPIFRDSTHFFTSLTYRNQNEDIVVTAPYDGGRYRGLFELPTDETRFLFKLSHSIGSSHRFITKALVSDRSSVEGVGGFDIFENRAEVKNYDLAVHATLVSELGSVLSELRVGFTSERFRTAAGSPPLGAALIVPTLGNIGTTTRFERADEDHWEVAETLTFSRGNHNLKTGVSLLRIESTSELDRWSDGAFWFSPTEPARAGLFWQSFVGADTTTRLERGESHLQLFVQDDWQPTPYFSVNLGLLWEKESSVPDDNNVAPRLGFHWDVTRDGRTSLRGGYGVFHSFVFSIVDSLERLFGPSGFRTIALSADTVAFPNPPDALQEIPASEPPNLYLDAPRYSEGSRRSPYAQHLTFGVERELVSSLSLAVDVSHIRGSNLILPLDVNAPSFFDYTSGGTRTAAEADATRPGADPSLPFGDYRDLYLLDSRGSTRFWGIRANVTKRYTANAMLQAVYNWSRTRNDGDDYLILDSLPLNPESPDLEWGRSAADIPHAIVVNGIWDAPYGFQLTGLLRARSGRVVDPRVDLDLDGDRKLRERPFEEGSILERNSFRLPPFRALDIAVSKGWELGEGRRLRATLEVFNATNRLNARQYLRSYGPTGGPLPSFLEVVQAAPPRQFQLSVRFSF